MTTTTIRATKRRRAARASSCVFALLACWFGPAAVGVEAAEVPILTPFATAPGPQPPSPWHFTTLPNKAPTRFEVVELDGHRVLRVESDQSYGNLVHRVRVPLHSAASLAWRWRVDRLVQGADLRSRSGDDAAAKVCVFFDFPEDQLSLLERAGLAMARSVTGEDVPSEALCYVWDNRLPRGSLLPNAFTRRIRMLVLQSGPPAIRGTWVPEHRNLLADYRRAFGDEAGDRTPDVAGVSVSADADNTGGNGLAFIAELVLSAPGAAHALVVNGVQ